MFKVEVSAKPNYARNLWTYEYKQDTTVTIYLRLEDTNISLFGKAEEAYEIYSRFEILDL